MKDFATGHFVCLVFVIVPLLVLLTSFLLGSLVLAQFEGWDIWDGLWFVAGNITGQPNPLVSNMPTTMGGKLMVVCSGLLALILSSTVIGLVAMMSFVGKLADKVGAYSRFHGFLVLFVALPTLIAALCAVSGVGLALVDDNFSYWDGMQYTFSMVCGLGNPLTGKAPVSWIGKVLCVVLGTIDESVAGLVVGFAQSLGFVVRAMEYYERFKVVTKSEEEGEDHLPLAPRRCGVGCC